MIDEYCWFFTLILGDLFAIPGNIFVACSHIGLCLHPSYCRHSPLLGGVYVRVCM